MNLRIKAKPGDTNREYSPYSKPLIDAEADWLRRPRAQLSIHA